MSDPIATLRKILELEMARGYGDDAVVGGLSEYARIWHMDMMSQIKGKESAERVAHITQFLSDYALTPAEARPSTIRHLRESLAAFAVQTPKQKGGATAKKGKQTAAPAAAAPAAALRLAAPAHSGLHAPLTSLSGVGPKLAQTLARLDLHQVGDLLWHLPHRYQDYSNLRRIADLRIGDEITIRATVRGIHGRRTHSGRTLTTAQLGDESGKITATFWNPYIDKVLHPGRAYFFSGKVSSYQGERLLESPEFEEASDDPTHTARIVPIYALTEGLSARVLRKIIRQAVETWAPQLPDPLPASLRQRLGYPDLGLALSQVHFPDDAAALDRARKRLAFDELLAIQLGVLGQHRAWQSKPAQPLPLADAHLAAFVQALPFTLTAAQQRVLADIRRDLRQAYPMTRLLQGDVGSGKTVIAAAALWAAICQRAQGAIMAPTEILAEQHFRKLQELFAKLLHPVTGWPLRVALLTGSVTGKAREGLLADLAAGEIDLLVGTHALIQEGVRFANLALIVVDEQHRFGVDQRAALREKGGELNPSVAEAGAPPLTPHTLVMSATPIPRTLALTIYGDMDVSAIDELPPGRQPIKTYWVKPEMRPRVYKFIRAQVEEGRQAFIIYPLVEDSARLEDVGAAVAEHQRLSRKVFPALRLGLLHGRLSGREKDAIMQDFAGGRYHILVSTAVVEVGIDIPNASVMLIENAERFGLSQLHQFRGRVGRGPHPSYCILVSDPANAPALERMQAIERTQDGFELAEIDLTMRGPGEFFGARQSGLPDLKLARMSDARLLELARKEAAALLDADPGLQHPDHQLLAHRMTEFWSQELDLS